MTDTDPLLIASPMGITAILRTIAAQNALVHIHTGNIAQALITTLLHIDPDEHYLLIDAASDDTFNQRLSQASTVYFETIADAIRIQFQTGPASALLHEGREAFRVPYPDSLRRLQRRDHYRVDIPVNMPLLCAIPTQSSQPLRVPVKNISAGGIALLDPDHKLDIAPGKRLEHCTLSLDNLGTVSFHILVHRIEVTASPVPKRVIGGEFHGISAADAIKVQNYIGQLERMLNARRRHFD